MRFNNKVPKGMILGWHWTLFRLIRWSVSQQLTKRSHRFCLEQSKTSLARSNLTFGCILKVLEFSVSEKRASSATIWSLSTSVRSTRPGTGTSGKTYWNRAKTRAIWARIYLISIISPMRDISTIPLAMTYWQWTQSYTVTFHLDFHIRATRTARQWLRWSRCTASTPSACSQSKTSPTVKSSVSITARWLSPKRSSRQPAVFVAQSSALAGTYN